MNAAEKRRTLEAIRFGARHMAAARKRREYAGEQFLLDLSIKALSLVPAEWAEEAQMAFRKEFDKAMEDEV